MGKSPVKRSDLWTLPLGLLLVALAACASIEQTAQPPPQTALETQAALPDGYEDVLVAAVASPTALAFAPDGRLLITTQPGQLHIYQNGALRAQPALDLGPKLCKDFERGLLGVAVDPNFAATGYLYLYYTFDRAGTRACARNTAKSPVNRVSRFTLSGNIVSPGSERVLLDNIPSPNGNHNGGDLHVGKDGLLYVSVGDGGCDYRSDSGCAGANDAARDRHTLLGKVLRITRTGGIPTSNPYRGSLSARCNRGNATPGQVCQETFAWGLRNPFRLAFDLNSRGTRFYINDVGQNAREEINVGKAGADYGWNKREGSCNLGASSCGGTPTGLTDPLLDYARNTAGIFQGCKSITGGAFVPDGLWPGLGGSYLFSDYVCGKIFKLTPIGTGSSYNAGVFASGLGASSAVHLTFGPHGGSQALFYTSYAGGGQVRRVGYTGSSNAAPRAVATATPSSGAAPLAVTFSAAGSSDPEGGALRYSWTFDDGTVAEGASVSRTFEEDGVYPVTLSVRDPGGAEARETVHVSVGNTPPDVRIVQPADGATFGVGDPIDLHAEVSDAEDDPLDDDLVSWSAVLHHDTHTHPYLSSTTGREVGLIMPAPEDLAATDSSYLEVFVTASDSGGLSRTVSRKIYPKKVPVTFRTDPVGLSLEVNGVGFTAPRTFTSWQGFDLKVTAASQTTPTGGTATPQSWSDGGALSHTILTPASAATYTASFDVRTEAAGLIKSFTLINAETDQPVLGSYLNGSTLDLATLPTRKLNVRANSDPARVGSVRFSLNGALHSTDNSTPYALAGNKGTDYYAWTPNVGEYTLSATPYSGPEASGAVGTARTIRFRVIDSSR